MSRKGRLTLEDGSSFEGQAFASLTPASGELVFNTAMVGYPEALTDPSYKGQILVLTYPLIGNYGVSNGYAAGTLDGSLESERLQISGLIVSEFSNERSHWSAAVGFKNWLTDGGIPALSGIDTRLLTKRLRHQGSVLAKIEFSDRPTQLNDPNKTNVIAEVSIRQRVIYHRGRLRIVVVDCGCKYSILRQLLDRDVTVIRVPYDCDFFDEESDGIVVSNGPGDPKMCLETITTIQKAMEKGRPILGICLGTQLLALAAGANTYKLKFGHRGQNSLFRRSGSPGL